MRQTSQVRGAVMLSVPIACIAAACGSGGGSSSGTGELPPPPTAELVVNVEFGSELAETVTASLHVWALRPKAGVSLSCNDLIGGKVDPYDFSLTRLADHVSTEVADSVTLEAVEEGDVYVYVEGVTFGGEAENAGCETTTVAQPSATVGVTLQTAGAFDCEAPDTEDGSPCDDGLFCTVGETCQDGSCQGGRARNCSALADDCSAAACDETQGCQVTPVADDTPCDDGLFCTENDSCQEGLCVGSALDCDAQAGPCRAATGCNETLGSCTFTNINEGLDCDDGLHCTVSTFCFAGVCTGGATRDCSLEVTGDDCNVPACSEDEGGCYTEFADTSTVCDDTANECTQDFGLCDGAGACEATALANDTPCDGDMSTCLDGVCQ